jgi:hypothetical protein
MRMLLLALCAGLPALPASPPIREKLTQAVSFPDVPVPQFRHGFLVLLHSPTSNGLSAFGPDGSLAFDQVIELPGGGLPSTVTDVDFDQDGNAAVAAGALGTAPCMVNGVLLLDRAGRQIRFIDTGCFVPGHVAIAPDHSIWTFGYQVDPGNLTEDRQDYMTVRQFTFDGKQVSAFLPRSSFPKGLAPGAAFFGRNGIVVTADRVGVLAHPGEGSVSEWVELDLNGNVRDRLRTPQHSPIGVFAFTADGHVFLGGHNNDLLTIDPALHEWKSLPHQSTVLMGADANTLVYRKSGLGPIELQWFNQP